MSRRQRLGRCSVDGCPIENVPIYRLKRRRDGGLACWRHAMPADVANAEIIIVRRAGE